MGRNKKLKIGIESIKKEIENHFKKLEKDLERKDFIYAGYHAKELDKSLITTLEKKMNILDEEDKGVVEGYRERLRKLMKGFEE